MDGSRIQQGWFRAVPVVVALAIGGGIVDAVVESAMLDEAGQGWGAEETRLPLAFEAALVGVLTGLIGGVLAGLTRRRWVGIVVGVVSVVVLLVATREPPPERGPGPAPTFGGEPRTLVLVTLDTLRRDHVSAYPDGRLPGLTPTLEALADDGIRFDGARAPAPLTLPVHTSMLTGKLPVEHGILRNGMVLADSEESSLPELLAAAGYRTAAFTSSSVLHGAHGLARWFSVYRDRLGARSVRDGLPASGWLLGRETSTKLQKEPGDRTVSRALSWLDRAGDEPVFLWVHLYDAHAPHHDRPRQGGEEGAFDLLPHPCDYVGHPGQRARTTPRLGRRAVLADEATCRQRPWTGLRHRVGAYAAEVAFADAQLGRLIEGLKERGRWADSALIVAADHGESLTEHQQMVSHQYNLYEPVLRVPLIVRPAGGRGGWPAVVDEPVGTVQVAATLARLAGLPRGTIGNQDLLAVAEGEAAGPETEVSVAPAPLPVPVRHAVAIWAGDRKVISLGGHRYERYALDDDPAERVPLRADDDAPAPSPPEFPRSAERRRGIVGLPGVPGPLDIVEQTHAAAWPRPEDESAWQPLPPELAPDFDALEARGDTTLIATEGRDDAGPEVDPALPDDVREALEALGYLQ